MAKTFRSTKRLAAIICSLALLCGMVVGTNLFVSASQTEVDKYSVDFSELSALVAQDGGAFESGYYVPQEDDANINAWVDTYFTALTKRTDGRWYTCETLGKQPESWTTKWQIAENAGLGHTGAGGAYLEKVVALTLGKDGENLELKNFEASVVFNTNIYKSGAVFLSFHEQVPGRFGHDASADAAYLGSDAVLVAANADIEANTGREKWQAVFARSSGEAIDDTWAADYPTSVRVSSTLVPNTDYKLYVKVVNGVVYYTLTSVDGATTYYSGTDTVGNTAGAISVGIAGHKRILKSIEVTELDNKGKAVDLGTFATKLNTPVEVDEYAVDFSELSALVAQDGGAFGSGYYVPQVDDANINAWVDTYFTALTKRTDGRWNSCDYLGTQGDTWATKWRIFENGGLGHSGASGAYLEKLVALTLGKDGEDLKLKNFEASVVFNTNTYHAGAVFLSFHEQVPGRFGHDASVAADNLQSDAVLVAANADIEANTGREKWQAVFARSSGEAIDDTWAADYPTSVRVSSTLVPNTDYKLYVKVVNGVANYTLTSVDGATTYYSGADTVSNTAGAISVGIAGRARVLKSLKVTELDEDGIPVDLGTYANPVEDPITVNQFKADFAELAALVDETAYVDGFYQSKADDTAINEWVDARFKKMTYNGESHTFVDRTYLGEEIKKNSITAFWKIDKNGYLVNNQMSAYSEAIRSTESLTLKGADGEYAVLDNFEAKVVFKNATSHRGVVFITFNEQTPGSFGWNGDYTTEPVLNRDAVLVGIMEDRVSDSGVSVKGYGDTIPDSLYSFNEVFTNKLTAGENAVDHELTVKVIGANVYVKVVNLATGELNWEKTYVNAVKGTSGTVSIGAGRGARALKSITVTKLDEVGLPVDFVEVPAEPEQADNTAVVDGNTITVKAGEGYELKAGSLVVTDANNNVFVPTRVGYREGGDATQYTIPEAAVAPFEVDYEFIQPGAEDGYNVGFLGISTNAEKGGLRFVNRFYVDENGEMLYNGEKVAVKEYGMLVASAAILPDAADLDIETAQDSMHVHQIKWGCEGGSAKFYDKCADYADVSVQIVGIPEGAARALNFHTRAYIVLADEDETVVYMDAVSANYNNG